MKPPRIEVTSNERGFHVYGGPVVCSYGSKVYVYESSAASEPHVWIRVQAVGLVPSCSPGEGVAHLNLEQVRGIIARLQTWLDEIPERWGVSSGGFTPKPPPCPPAPLWKRILTLGYADGHPPFETVHGKYLRMCPRCHEIEYPPRDY